MLGVATMIVVNAVMEGFTHEMQERIHGILSDIVFESATLDGIPDAERHMEQIRQIAGDDIAGMSPTVHVPAMLSFKVGRQYVNKQISLIGVDEKTYSSVSDFGRYLQHPENREQLDFKLKDGGYDTENYEAAEAGKGVERPQMDLAGWLWRRQVASFQVRAVAPAGSTEADPFNSPNNPLAATEPEGEVFDPAKKQHDGCVLGISLVSYRNQDGSDSFLSLPGDDVEITYPTAGTPPKPLSASFTVVDFYESKMNDYDSSFVFVPIRKLQELRGTIDPVTSVGNFNSIQIRLKPGADMEAVRDKIRAQFSSQLYIVNTWRDKQGALLAAVQMETAVLNVLLFMIIAVAGFGILAIFLMIVVEKTRDIGILKSLGATGSGIMTIFLSYGLSLGVVGAGVGVALGLSFVVYINEIADVLGRLTGRPVFDPSIYYFHEIPTMIEPLTVVLVAIGAIVIAILASILPAWRAARLHPVEALRYE
jgi:lipoprotein-releasing system permease protein